MPTATKATIEHLKGTEWQQSRSFSPAVIAQGGRTVYLAGQTTLLDVNGNDISGNFEAQAPSTPQQFDKLITRDIQAFMKLARAAGIKAN